MQNLSQSMAPHQKSKEKRVWESNHGKVKLQQKTGADLFVGRKLSSPSVVSVHRSSGVQSVAACRRRCSNRFPDVKKIEKNGQKRSSRVMN